MNAHVRSQNGAVVEIEFSPTKSDQHLDRAVYARLLQLADIEVEVPCRFRKHDNHLVIQLDESRVEEVAT